MFCLNFHDSEITSKAYSITTFLDLASTFSVRAVFIRRSTGMPCYCCCCCCFCWGEGGGLVGQMLAMRSLPSGFRRRSKQPFKKNNLQFLF